ncbi:hypothetical protein QBC47DRAFT_103775 [Echria macrotheca]|uniref:Uncharacterized protein n=1 Tax=Echria macrotheca TaxID=438768 RepID=A0AAJ0BJI5_9PEZI|nr:hypothetical protein QBC47DRAFT_103775 [Echria macrotheca]
MEHPQFPFGVTAGPSQNAGLTNAADSHILDVQAVQSSLANNEGDVLAVITLDSEFEQGRSCTGKRWQTMQLRMSSQKLRSLDSKKINDMFDPKRQERVRRRLGFGLTPPGVEYVLDFTPPAEGPELADLTAALWLPRMVKLWFLAGYYLPPQITNTDTRGFHGRPLGDKAVGAMMALGHDDVCNSESCLNDLSLWEVDPNVRGIFEDQPLAATPKHIPAWRKIEDYCRIRHRASIMRLLRAINGDGLLLNSASRMWTVAQVAIHLEVPRVVVDPVTQWLVAPPNTKFIEMCPEKAFQLAYALRIPSVLIASFKILVSELAVDFAADTPSPRPPLYTWIERKRDDYGDFPSDPVEYAAIAMVDRIDNHLKSLLSDDALSNFCNRVEEWESLKLLEPIIMAMDDPGIATAQLKTSYSRLVSAIKAVFKRAVTESLLAPMEGHYLTLVEAQRSHYISPAESSSAQLLYQKLNDVQKALTPIFWETLDRKMNSTSLSESTYNGKQLYWIANDFVDQFRKANARRLIRVTTSGGPLDAAIPLLLDNFSLVHLIQKAVDAVHSLCQTVLDRKSHIDSAIPFFLSDHLLLSLDQRELDYLPIWAGGLDDDSGGVFQVAIPPAEMGPSEPGPAYHTGYTVPSNDSATAGGGTSGYGSTVAPSDLGIGNLDIYSDASTARSMDAQQSVTTGPARGRVVPVPESFVSDSFSNTVDNDYAEARFEMPAEHQHVGQAVAKYVEELGGSEADTLSQRADSDDMAWSTVESVRAADTIVSTQSAAAAAPATNQQTSSQSASTGLDGFGLEQVEDVNMDVDDSDDDRASTIDGSEFDLIEF